MKNRHRVAPRTASLLRLLRLLQSAPSSTARLVLAPCRPRRGAAPRLLIAAVTLLSLIIGAAFHPRATSAAEPLVELHTYYSSSRGDYFTTTDPRYTGCRGCAFLPDYRWIAVEGVVFNPDLPKPDGAVPLYHWYSGDRGDNFLTTHPQWTGRVGDARGGYTLFRIEGYVYPTARAGTVPLHGWWNASLQDNYTTTQFSTGAYTPQGYGWYRVEGYLQAPDLVVTALQVTGASRVYSADPDIALVPVRFVVKNQGPVAAPSFKVSLEKTRSDGTYSAGFVAADTGDVRSDGAWSAFTRWSLAPGREVIVTGTAYVSRSPRPTSLSAIADSCSGEEFMPTYCRVLESDERNNSRSVSISVP